MKAVGWFFINAFQLFWLGAFTTWCWLVVLTIYAITWNPDTALSLARSTWGPVNIRFGFSKLVIEGEENFPQDRPFILMMNHQSMVDILLAWMIGPVPVRFIAKHVLRYVPVVGATMLIFGMVSIDRGDAHAAAKALKRAARVLRNGRSLCAFPEGTRTRDGKIGPFKRGVFLLAMKAGVPIVPVAMEGANIVVPRTGWKPRPATMRMRIGPPIATDGPDATRDVIIKRVRDSMIDMHLAIGGAGGDKDAFIAGAAPGGAAAGGKSSSTDGPEGASVDDTDGSTAAA